MKIFVRTIRKLIRIYEYLMRHEGEALRNRSKSFPPGQWHRWYKKNRKWQRQLTALRRLGHSIPPNVTGLRRHMVK